MSKEVFWTDQDSEPKRNHRFRLNFTGLADSLGIADVNWLADKVDRPKPSTSYEELPFYQHKFKYPGSTVWNDVSVTFRDPALPDVMAGLYSVFKDAGYRIPNSPSAISTISKKKMVAAVGDIVIAVIDSDGRDIETWVLRNAQIGDITPSGLGHDDQGFSKIDLVVKYDFAELNENRSTFI